MNKRLLNIIKTNFDHYLEEQLKAPTVVVRVRTQLSVSMLLQF